MAQSQIKLTDLTASSPPPSTNDDVAGDIIAYGRGDTRDTTIDDVQRALRRATELAGHESPGDDELDDMIEGALPYPVLMRADIDPAGEHNKSIKKVLSDVQKRDVESLVATSLTHLSSGFRDAVAVAEELVDYGVTVHLIDDDLVLEPGIDETRGVLAGLRVAANAERRDVHRQVVPAVAGEKPWRGQPPLGFETNDEGRLVPSYDYEQICGLLEQVQNEERSKREVARLIGCTRRTITRCIDQRPEMYGLDD